MARCRYFAFAASCAVILNLAGCGGDLPTSPTTIVTTSTTTTTTATTTADMRTPLYIIARMDDVAVVDHSQQSADVINWFLEHKLKFNFGVITGSSPGAVGVQEWPSTCGAAPSGANCDDPAVKAVYDAYADGKVLGSGEEAILEIGDHAYDHNGWPRQWSQFKPHKSFSEWQDGDFGKSAALLRKAFPNASIRYFAAPENLADKSTLLKMKKHGLDIVSAQATIGCPNPQYKPGPPRYDYIYAPCEAESDGVIGPQCMPEGDIWITEDGYQSVGDVLSVPVGSANSHWPQDLEGISAKETIGLGDCGCYNPAGKTDRVTCSIVASAKHNANKSGGLLWTGMMMHPQTNFTSCCGHDNYTRWLDDFHQEVMGLEDYNVRFINFQDVQRVLRLPVPAEGLVV